jgi:polyisoprenoid-binding protein YceI
MHVLALALVAAFAQAASPAAAQSFTLDPAASAVTYHIVHKLHRVEGRSVSLEGKAVLQPDGKLLAMVRASVSSFDSGDRNRDTHMQEVMETSRFPFVVVKGVSQVDGALLAVAQKANTIELKLQADVDVHGVREPMTIPLTVELRPDGTARVKGAFEVSLEKHQIERPSLLFVKIEDACRVELDLLLRVARS